MPAAEGSAASATSPPPAGARALPVGESALLVEGLDASTAARLAASVRRDRARWGEPVEVVPGAETVLLDGLRDVAAAVAAVATWEPEAAAPGTDRVVLPVRYDGADLERVARLWQVSVAEVVARHTATEFTVAFCGFAPGFAYLTGLPAAWAVPRLATPRPRVPVGSVALAGSWCGVYPTSSPGGWLLLGTTDAPLWDLDRARPALLEPGARVRCQAV